MTAMRAHQQVRIGGGSSDSSEGSPNRSVGQVAHQTALRAHQQVSRTGGSSDSSEGSPTGE